MAKIQDLRSYTSKVAKSSTSRSINDIKVIVRHHSAGDSGDFYTFWKYWQSKGWSKGGYHEIILRDGTVQLCYDAIYPTNGVAKQNSYIYNICLVGNGNFTAAQEKAWIERCLLAQERFKVANYNVKGHNEMPGANTACPGINMHVVRNRLLNAQKGDVKPVAKDYYQVGDRGEGVKKLQADYNKVGYKLVVDGIFGKATQSATEDFQREHKLAVDGVAGKNTLAKLADVLKPKPQETLYSVTVDGKQVGAFGEHKNVEFQVASALKSGKKKIVIEQV